MKKVLIIGPDFTPSSLPPALRIQNFVRHLPEFGWEPVVLSVDPRYYDWPFDAGNQGLLPESLQVTRTQALPTQLMRKLGIGDIALRSFAQQLREAYRLCKDDKIDLVFISMPPNYQAVIGRLMHASFGIPYVIDYIDPWVSINYRKLPRAQRPLKRTIAYTVARILEPFVLRRVGHITGVSKGTTDHVLKSYRWLSETGSTEIPYGGDANAFEYLRQKPRVNQVFDKDDGLRHVSYIGACNYAMQPTLVALFEAVRLGLHSAPALFQQLRLHFVGTSYAANASGRYQVLPLARAAGLEQLVDERPQRVSYLDALQLLLDSHALLVLGSDAPHYTPSKIFPYILAQKPLLVVFHEASNVVSILKETQAAEVVTFNSAQNPDGKVVEISERLEEILRLPTKHQPTTRWDAFAGYTTRAMTLRLVQAFDKASEDGRESKPRWAQLSTE